MARTAVVAGTATAVSGNVARRGAARSQQQADAAAYQQAQQQAAMQAQAQAAAAEAAAAQAAAQPAPAAAPAAGEDTIAKLKELAELKSAGILTDEEFGVMKAKILAG
jgi:hypothetical protein